MEQREQQIITNCEELQGWRTPEGEEQDYVKGFLIKSLNDGRMSKPWICGGFWMMFLVFAVGTANLVTEFTNLITDAASFFWIILGIIFCILLTVICGACMLMCIRDTERRECVDLLWNGNMKVLDVSIKKVHSGRTSSSRVDLISAEGQECSLATGLFSQEKQPVKEWLLVKVVRKNELEPNFWVIPVYIKNGRSCKIGMNYLHNL